MSVPKAGALAKASDWTTVFPVDTDAWTTYTPAWTSTGTQPALGNGSIVGAYTKIGRTVHYRIIMTVGSTSTFGSGVYLWSLPFTATVQLLALASIVDSSAGTRFGRHVYLNTGTTVFAYAEAGTFVGPTAPMTWATSDSVGIGGTFEATT